MQGIKDYKKPVFVASEIGITDSTNPGPSRLIELGSMCYNSPSSAVRSLEALTKFSAMDKGS